MAPGLYSAQNANFAGAADDAVVSPHQGKALLLQGPVGPFFARLQEEMDAAGWQTAKVQFNGGDCAFHGAGRDVHFSGPLEQFSTWLEGFLKNFKPDVVLMFGDQRPIHASARRVCENQGVAVVAFEEGYSRPNYITMESGGNNALSPLRSWTAEKPRQKVNAAPKVTKGAFFSTASFATKYFIMLRLDIFRFPYYEHHRDRGLWREGAFWIRNAWRKYTRRVENLQTIQSIIEHIHDQYFVVALQVHDDLQVRSHGEGWTNEKLIESALATFGETAPGGFHLVFKGHPMDRGHSSSQAFVTKMARIYGLEDRVHYVCDGSLGLLCRHSRGMVTINSTSALISLGHFKPVFALGASFYETLTANGRDRSIEALRRFWRVAPVVDPERWEAFRAEMINASLVPGSFYLPELMEATCRRVIARLQELIKAAGQPASVSSAREARKGAPAVNDEAA